MFFRRAVHVRVSWLCICRHDFLSLYLISFLKSTTFILKSWSLFIPTACCPHKIQTLPHLNPCWLVLLSLVERIQNRRCRLSLQPLTRLLVLSPTDLHPPGPSHSCCPSNKKSARRHPWKVGAKLWIREINRLYERERTRIAECSLFSLRITRVDARYYLMEKSLWMSVSLYIHVTGTMVVIFHQFVFWL